MAHPHDPANQSSRRRSPIKINSIMKVNLCRQSFRLSRSLDGIAILTFAVTDADSIYTDSQKSQSHSQSHAIPNSINGMHTDMTAIYTTPAERERPAGSQSKGRPGRAAQLHYPSVSLLSLMHCIPFSSPHTVNSRSTQGSQIAVHFYTA